MGVVPSVKFTIDRVIKNQTLLGAGEEQTRQLRCLRVVIGVITRAIMGIIAIKSLITQRELLIICMGKAVHCC